ncbi:MAG: cysteine--tRNA ligase [Candidatus Micrarchaeota archaeon]
MLRLYNTYTRRKEEFKSLKNKEVRMYCCGPTVYNYAHIGNLRTYVFEDVLRRFLIYRGYKMLEVMNFTDVDDKTIKGAKQENVSLKEFTEKYEKLFIADCSALNIQPPEVRCKATEHIKEMVDNIKQLMEKGYAYKASDGSVYYKLAEFPEYGLLSHLDLAGLKPGARVSSDEYEKEGASDFALWKAWTPDDGNVYWETELGKGRPGWHIECSAMSTKYLGNFFDIHSGGIDLIFPHHENEIAQSQPLSGKPLANYWVHGGHLLVDGQRMGKRFKNFYTLADLAQKGFSPLVLRYFYVSSHYRQQLNFTFEALQNCQNTLNKLQLFLDETKRRSRKGKPSVEIEGLISGMLKEVDYALGNDLETPTALAVLHKFVKKANRSELSPVDCTVVVEALKLVDSIFGFFNWMGSEKKVNVKLKAEVEKLLAQRAALRSEKKFKEADEIRDKIAALGVIVEDSPTGQVWRLA